VDFLPASLTIHAEQTMEQWYMELPPVAADLFNFFGSCWIPTKLDYHWLAFEDISIN
jgi:hypothetical protein